VPDMGIVKVDLLGLGMMAVIEECLQLIPPAYGEMVDLAHLPQDDPAVFEALQKADTVGMFQVESRAQMSALPRMMPRRFYDIVVQVPSFAPAHRRQNGASLPQPPPGQGKRPIVSIPRSSRCCAAPSACRYFRSNCCACHDRRRFTGGEAEELRRAMASSAPKSVCRYRSETARRHDTQRHRR